MLPHQERVVQEKKELDEKLVKLTEFIGLSSKFRGLDSNEKARLYRQHKHMMDYSMVLGERIDAFTKDGE
jgi:hypothetical protein